ncbi:hypothetical protein PCASD_21752 [Puccinia coronata f. sp. avenae]|uniref:Uncharacterized protein n=1 Tax=Puccinia coronata f. sp. avenae TaxID=200324 RepID=A0A2N5T6H1_9BASI|nr:hypothetical protein PCASD_21752 [Puccinia coronata f. sp. avenae]
MSYKLIGQWLFDMGCNTLSNPTLKKSVKQPCPTWDWTEWSNPMLDKMVVLACPTKHRTILSDAVSDKPTGWVFFSGGRAVNGGSVILQVIESTGLPSCFTPAYLGRPAKSTGGPHFLRARVNWFN